MNSWSAFSLLLRMLRRHIASPYIFLWRTVELLAIIRLARQHGYDLTRQLDFDAGCGNGIIGQSVTARIGIGFDIDAQELRWARNQPAYQALLQGSLHGIPLADGSQQSIFCNSVMEHIADDQGALRELARVLAPGGYLLLTLAGHDLHQAVFGSAELDADFRQAFDAGLAHEHYYDESGIMRQLAALGIETLATAAYMTPRQARYWAALRNWQRQHPHTGWAGRFAQLCRVPVTLSTLALLRPVLAAPQIGAGLAVVARRPPHGQLSEPSAKQPMLSTGISKHAGIA